MIKWTNANLEKHYLKHEKRFTSQSQYRKVSEALINKPVGKYNIWGANRGNMKIRYDLNTGLFVKAENNIIITAFKTTLGYYLKMIANKPHKRQHEF